MKRKLTPSQLRALRCVAERPGDVYAAAWKLDDAARTGYEAAVRFKLSIAVCERLGLVTDGRTIGEDGRTVHGVRWQLTDEGRAALKGVTLDT